MIIDCFPFWKELDILEIRLNELYSTVDKFVLVEASRTQSLLLKPYFFEKNKERFAKFLDKIIHLKIEDYPENSSNLWNMENFQRNCITRGLNQLNLLDEDIVLISDVDEIPSAKSLRQLKENKNFECGSFSLNFFAYFLNLMCSNRKWIGTTAVKYRILKQYTPQFFRGLKDSLPIIPNGGWHFSWCGGYKEVYEKAHACIEPFDKTALPSIEEFQKHFENFLKSDNKFFIHLENLSKQETEFKKTNIDQSFPKFVLENQDKLNSFIL